MMSNAAFSKDPGFMKACEKAKVESTTAQASKYRRGFGAAYNAEHDQAPGSRASQKQSSADAMEAQRIVGTEQPQEYGPYAANRYFANTMPKARKK